MIPCFKTYMLHDLTQCSTKKHSPVLLFFVHIIKRILCYNNIYWNFYEEITLVITERKNTN